MKWFGQKASGLLLIVVLTLAILSGTGGNAMGKYLTVDDSNSQYVEVQMDGIKARFWFNRTDGSSDAIEFFDAVGTELAKSRSYYIGEDDQGYHRGNDMKVINRSLPIVLRLTGEVRNYTDGFTLPESNGLTILFYVYSDRIFMDFNWDLSGNLSASYGSYDSFLGLHETTIANTAVYESSGSEVSDSGTAYTVRTGNYVGTKATELNSQVMIIYDSTGLFKLMTQMGAPDGASINLNGNDLVSGNVRLVAVLILDSAERENDGGTFNNWVTATAYSVGDIVLDSGLRYYCMIAHTSGTLATDVSSGYWVEYRIALGDQYKDLVMAVPTTGSEVTDLVIPLDLASDGFASDGGRHLEMATDEVKYTVDRARIGHVDVVEVPPIETGTVGSSTDHRIERIEADDNAASSTVVAAVGDNANWETSEGASRNTDNDDISTDINRGTGLDTAGTYHIEHVVTAYDNAYFKAGTKIINFTPQFAFDVAADQTIWSLYVDAGDYIQITYDAGNDMYELRVSWGGTLTTLQSSAYTTNYSLQQLIQIQASWDSDEDLLQLVINGQVVANGTNTGTPSASAASYVMTGADCVTDADGTGQLEADIFIDWQDAYDGMFRLEGSYFTGNGSVDTGHAHNKIAFVWNGSDTTPIGSDVTSNGDYTQTGPIGNSTFRNDAASEYATAVTSGNISATEGSLGFWFKPNSALGADCTLFYADAAFKVWWDDSENDVVFTYNTDVLNMNTAFSAGDTNWHYVEIGWDASTRLHITVDGDMAEQTSGVDSAPTLDANMYFTADDASGTNRANVMMSDFIITNSIGTPQWPVILGSGPIHGPIQGIE